MDKGKVEFNKTGVVTNRLHQSTSNPKVYPCGDAADKNLPLSSLSGRQGYVVVENLLHVDLKKLKVPVIPSVVFLLPYLTTVGYSAEEASFRYKNIRVNFKIIAGWLNAKRINAPLYAYKIILNDRIGEIVGAHLLGPKAGETINNFSLASNNKMTDKDIKSSLFSYPSWASDIKNMV